MHLSTLIAAAVYDHMKHHSVAWSHGLSKRLETDAMESIRTNGLSPDVTLSHFRSSSVEKAYAPYKIRSNFQIQVSFQVSFPILLRGLSKGT